MTYNDWVARALREHEFRQQAARAMRPSTCKRPKPLPWWRRLFKWGK